MERNVKIKGLHCANCALELEEELSKINGVTKAQVDFLSQTVRLDAESEAAFKKAIKHINKFEQVRVVEGGASVEESHKNEWIRIGISAILFVVAFALSETVAGRFGAIAAYVAFGFAYFIVGYPVLVSTAKNVAKGKVFDENFLMTIASVGAVLLGVFGGEGAYGVSEGVLVMLLYQIGECLQEIAVGSSRRSVTELMKLKSESATLVKDGEQRTVNPEELVEGDVVLVKAGEKIPADGRLLGERATLDTKSLTGEAEPKEFSAGDELLSGYINVSNVFTMQITRPYKDCATQKILDLVEKSTAKKAAPEKFITKFARYYTPIVCVLALFVAFLAPALHAWIGGGTYGGHFSRWATSALNFLVISCPCALIISVPLTYFSGIGACAKRGVLVKGATYLDVAAKAKTVAFDKTGTLTTGDFSVRALYPESGTTKEELLKLAASAEKASSHPLAKAFEDVVESLYSVEEAEELAGKGLRARAQGKTFLVGNAELLKENGVSFAGAESVYTVVYVASDSEYKGWIEIGDAVRADAASAICDLKTCGAEEIVMLTGDGKRRAESVGKEIGIDRVEAELYPEDKLKKAEELKKKGALLYVGDGINDAPVMAAADCAASMGKLGSVAAVEASDLVLVSDRLSALPECLKIAKKTKKIVMENIIFSVSMKAVFMILGLFGVLPLWLAVFGDVGVMLLAVLNSLRMKSKRLQ